MTYTVATMEVPADVYEMIKAKLKDAGYDHAIDEKEGMLDMTHIALVSAPLARTSDAEGFQQYHDLAQRAAVAAGLSAGANVLTELVPAIEKRSLRGDLLEAGLEAAKTAKQMYEEAIAEFNSLASALCLVGLEPKALTIMAWSEGQKQLVFDWASAVHFRASDNDVEVPTRPDFLPEPWRGPATGEGVWGLQSPTVF